MVRSTTCPRNNHPVLRPPSHRVILWNEVGEEEGTGIVHIAPGCGAEDFQLGKLHNLPALAPLDEFGVYLAGFGWLTGLEVMAVTDADRARPQAQGTLLSS